MIYGYVRLTKNPETAGSQRKTNKTFANGCAVAAAGMPVIKGGNIFLLSVETTKNNLPPVVSEKYSRQAKKGCDPFKKQGIKSERLKTEKIKQPMLPAKKKLLMRRLGKICQKLIFPGHRTSNTAQFRIISDSFARQERIMPEIFYERGASAMSRAHSLKAEGSVLTHLILNPRSPTGKIHHA